MFVVALFGSVPPRAGGGSSKGHGTRLEQVDQLSTEKGRLRGPIPLTTYRSIENADGIHGSPATGSAEADRDAAAISRRCGVSLRVVTAAAVVCVFLVVVSTGERGFETNDNSLMAAISSGDYTGSPDGRLVFVDAVC
jgi:hypothetical protein